MMIIIINNQKIMLKKRNIIIKQQYNSKYIHNNRCRRKAKAIKCTIFKYINNYKKT